MRGFTLVEMFIVIAIIGILATLAALDGASWIRNSRVNQGRDLVLADVENVKLSSMTGVPHAIIVSGGTGAAYTMSELSDTDGDFAKGAGESVVPLQTETLPSNVKITVAGDGELWFDRKGVPRTSSWGAWASGTTISVWYDTNNNGAIDPGEPERDIAISSLGRIKYEK